MIESFAARKYLQGALPFGQWAAASFAIGHDHAYIQQYIRRGVPRWLNEADRKILVRLYGLDGDRLKPPPKSARTVRTVKAYRPRQSRGNSSGSPDQLAGEQHRVEVQVDDTVEQVTDAELHRLLRQLPPAQRAFVVKAAQLALSVEPGDVGSREAA